jgi:nitrogen fixation protein FixH
MENNAGRKWPWIIALSIFIFIIAIIFAIKVALTAPVELSNYGMQNYHAYDANVNDIIEEKIAFDQSYTIAFMTPQLTSKGAVVSYKISDKVNNAVDNAKIEVVLTRPDTTDFDIVLNNPSVVDGVYTFKATDLPKLGRWDILAKISVGDKSRFYNLKADTRNPHTQEF